VTQKTETILDRIVADKRIELAQAKAATPPDVLRERLASAPKVRSFSAALAQPGIGLIAEVKKASPSRGLLRADFDPVTIAGEYANAAAAAISVLTDEKHFRGSLDHLKAIREALPGGPPLLRKDFIFDEYQLLEARFCGADAVLLIVTILGPALLQELLATTRSLGMDALVEVHDEAELDDAIAAKADIIGINNRDLRTFEVDLATSERLAPLTPEGTIVVAESGIFMREDVLRLQRCGVDAVLIGEALVTAQDKGATVRELFG
jgi:indole-3-glycerol phosphate synthase